MSKYKLNVPEHHLRFAAEMTNAELSKLTDQELMDYTAEYNSKIKDAFTEDLGEAQSDNDRMIELASIVYGNDSNQHRYCHRNFGKGETKVHKHYNRFISPDNLRWKVENARELAEEGRLGE